MVQQAILLCFLISSAIALISGAQGKLTFAGQKARPTPEVKGKLTDPQFIAEGAKLFADACSNTYCHGIGGSGGVGPRLRGKGLDAAYTFDITSNGIPATSMLSFKSELSEEQIWKLVAFIMSDPKTNSAKVDAPIADSPSSASKPREETMASSIVGNPQAGKALFFDSAQSKRCAACHLFAGEGISIGPELSKIGAISARELFKIIVLPLEVRNLRYATVTITLRSGDKIAGIRKEEDAQSIRVYDTRLLPAVLRSVRRADISKVDTSNESVMPKDYASIYSLKQLLDLVAFLKAPDSKSAVTLQDLFR